jgi:hypothetical protein
VTVAQAPGRYLMPSHGVSRARSSPRRALGGQPAFLDNQVIGRAAIFGAIRPGSRLCRGQVDWLRTGLNLIDEQPWYGNRKAHYAAILRRLAAYMDWRSRTTRPGHALLRCKTCRGTGRAHGQADPCRGCGGKPLSADTVGRAVAWLQENGLLGLVSPGTTPLLRAHVLHGREGNLAAVYVCTVPRKRSRPPRPHGVSDRQFADLSGSCKETDLVPHARGHTKSTPAKARAPRGQFMLPRSTHQQLHTHPKNRTEGLTAAMAIQDRSTWLRLLSPEHVRHLARPYFAAGWSASDVLYALDHDHSGRQYGYSAAVRHPPGWARARLSRWLAPDGRPLPSRTQIQAARRQRVLAEQEARRRRDSAAAAQAVDAIASGLGAAARAELAAVSEQAREAMARASLPVPARRREARPEPDQHSPARIRLTRAVSADAGKPLRGAVLARALLAARDPDERRAILAQADGTADDPDLDGR